MLPKLTLIGAGPGDAELITLKGLKALQNADVVLYDDLIAPEMLDHVPAATPTYYVGKRAGRHSFSQEDINRMTVDMALNYGQVVRLKGGDPFVFGRGFEEYQYARDNGIPCKIIPGVSSCIAVPASQGIPVTSRGVSESFWVITGTTRTGDLSSDLTLAAQSNATVVVMMGLKKLGELCALYIANGRSETPVAIIQNGTRSDEKMLIGKIGNITEMAERETIGCPAVIVIGQVVELQTDQVKQYLAHQEVGSVGHITG